jgi:hypothetical protein
VKITKAHPLTGKEKEEAWEFLQKYNYIPYQLFPEYGFIEGLRSSFFIAREGNKIVGWLHVIEKKNILASIEFGPLGDSVEIIIALLQKAFNYYRRKFFLVVRWMPYWYAEEDSEMIRRQIEIKWPVLTNANLIHWASKRISLNEPEEAIFKKFSENHRRNIKKGNSFSIECRVIAEKKIIENFIDGYVKMYQHRNLQVDHSAVQASFNKLHEFLISSGRGFFMGAFKDDVLLGGLIIIYQGKTAFYYKGYIDHEQRQMPINHVAFYHAILQSKQNNMQWFDFGGYAVDTTDEQLVNINKFKDGFKGELVQFSPSRMYGLNLLSRAAYSLLSLKNKILSR